MGWAALGEGEVGSGGQVGPPEDSGKRLDNDHSRQARCLASKWTEWEVSFPSSSISVRFSSSLRAPPTPALARCEPGTRKRLHPARTR